MTPNERKNRVQKASQVKIRPWFEILPIIFSLTFIVLSLTYNVYYGYQTYFRFMWREVMYCFGWFSVLIATILAFVNLIVLIRATKKMKYQQASLLGIILNVANLVLFGVGIVGLAVALHQYSGVIDAGMLSFFFILLILAALYSLVRMITSIVKYVTCKKAEYLD